MNKEPGRTTIMGVDDTPEYVNENETRILLKYYFDRVTSKS